MTTATTRVTSPMYAVSSFTTDPAGESGGGQDARASRRPVACDAGPPPPPGRRTPGPAAADSRRFTLVSDDPSTEPEQPAPATDEAEAVTGGGEAASGSPARSPISKRRRWLINGLIVFTTVLSIFAMLSVWANRLLFN